MDPEVVLIVVLELRSEIDNNGEGKGEGGGGMLKYVGPRIYAQGSEWP